MNSETEKAGVFLENINRDAEARCRQIRQETDRYIMSELNKARDRAHEDVKSFKQSEIDRLNEANNAGFSELEAQETKKLLDRRTEITNEVFAKAKARLVEFAAGENYLDFLKRSIENIKSAIGSDAVIILKPDDKKYEAELSELCREIKYDPAIEIGGCRAENIQEHVTADDTLEARLEAEKSGFYKSSGLSVTK